MSETVKSNLYPCAHCEQTGTCKNGKDGTSCSACVKRNEIFFLFRLLSYKGLLCGTCGGIGKAEPMTERMNKRMKPLLALFIIIFMSFMVYYFAKTNSEHFTAVLAFAGTLTGSVVGYYFSSNPINNE